MDAKELRIGNWVNATNGYSMISDIFNNNSVKLKGFNGTYEKLQPITLAPEILEKAGFVFNPFHNNWIIIKGGYVNSVKKAEGRWLYNNDASDAGCYMVADLEFVHELQNLYYCLNKEELQIEL